MEERENIIEFPNEEERLVYWMVHGEPDGVKTLRKQIERTERLKEIQDKKRSERNTKVYKMYRIRRKL